MSNTRKKVVHPPMCICVICDAEVAVIAAADKAEAADAAIDAGGSYAEAADADKALYAAVRAWREARKP